jgi:hypothetical protein
LRRAFARLALKSHLPSSLSDCCCLSPQFPGCPQWQCGRAPLRVLTKPVDDLGSDPGVAAGDAREHREMLSRIERSQPSVDLPSWLSRRRLRRTSCRRSHEIAIDSDDVDEALQCRE